MRRRTIELPTFAVAVVVHVGWLALTARFHDLPLWAVVPLAGILLAWHGSLQHEVVHGHPTRSPLFNTLVAGAPLALWLPLPIYRVSHLAHHRSELTDPVDDPESYYLTAEHWRRMGPGARLLHLALSTLAGRLALGPLVVVARLYAGEVRRIFARRGSGDRRNVGTWLLHAAACALVLLWVRGVCRIPIGVYLGAFVYPGLALTLLRSYLEHRPDPDGVGRSVVVEAGPLWSLVFLNNNLHAVHHRAPGLPWYQLPARWRAEKDEVLAENRGYRFGGYAEVARRFAFVPKDSPVHPTGRKPSIRCRGGDA